MQDNDSLADQCAIGPDGKLLDAWDIEFRHDPDDPNPLPRVQRPAPAPVSSTHVPVQEGRGFRKKDTTRLQEGLQAEKLDDDGRPIQKRTSRPRPAKRDKPAPQPADNIESDPDDEDFQDEDGDAQSTSDSDIEIYEDEERVLQNSEIAAALPSKTIPLTSGGRTQSRKKRKATTDAQMSKKARVDTNIEDVPNPTTTTSTLSKSASLSSVAQSSTSLSSIAPSMGNKKNYIYLFYEPVSVDHDGTSAPDTKYYKCWHGARQTFKMSKGMKHNVKNMVGHLSSKFPAMYQLYMSLQSRETLPTPFEVQIASGAPDISEADINRHMKSLKITSTSATINAAFDKQAAAAFDQSEFETILAEWMVACDQPFDQVDHPAFRRLLSYVHTPARKPLSIPGRTTIRKRIMKLGQDSIESMKNMFKELESKISISLDMWSSPNQYAFMAIVAHYVSNTGEHEELIIDFKEVIGEHSGENMAEIVWGTLTLYDITHKVIAFVMDNASNNDTLLKALEKRYEDARISFSAKDARGRCMPHTIHLAAILLLQECGAITSSDAETAASFINYQDVLFETLDDDEDDEDDPAAAKEDLAEDWAPEVDMTAIGRLRKIVRTVRSSPQRRKSWLHIAGLIHPSQNANGTSHIPLMLILDVRTRWSSTYEMLRRAILYETSIRHYIAANHRQLGAYELSDDDWANIKRVAGWLELFRSATTQMSTTSTPMISTTHAIFRGLQDNLKNILCELPNNVAPNIKSGILKAHRKLSDYFTKFDECPYYTWAAILDPRITYAELQADYSDNADLTKSLEASKAALYDRFNTVYASIPDPAALSSSSRFSHAALHIPISSRSEPQVPSFDFTSRFRRLQQQTSLNELDEYLRLPPQDFHSCNPMIWWYSQRHRFPKLYLFARDVLGIPGSAVAVERVFSGGRDTISLRRSSLKPDTIRILMIFKQNLRLRQQKLMSLSK